MTTFRWGILGTGSIAAQFTEGLNAAEGHVAAAVGSRTQASADGFAARHGIAQAHASYAGLAADEDLDAIYVATPHSRHLEDTLLCLAAGTPVLCATPAPCSIAVS